MSIDERIGFLLRAAQRAERDGDLRAARTFRRMAAEARPALLDTLQLAHSA